MLRKPFILVAIAWSAMALSHSVYADQSVADAVKQCAQTQNSLQRLVCFDRSHHDYKIILTKYFLRRAL